MQTRVLGQSRPVETVVCRPLDAHLTTLNAQLTTLNARSLLALPSRTCTPPQRWGRTRGRGSAHGCSAASGVPPECRRDGCSAPAGAGLSGFTAVGCCPGWALKACILLRACWCHTHHLRLTLLRRELLVLGAAVCSNVLPVQSCHSRPDQASLP